MIFTGIEEQAASDALRGLIAGWGAFARAASEGRFEDAEDAAAFTFGLWDAFEPVDPPGAGWYARALFLVVAP